MTLPVKPKITFICKGLVAAVGGAERVLCDVANHLAEAGYDVDVVTHEKVGGLPWFHLSRKVRFIPMRPLPETYGPLRRLLIEPLRDVASSLFRLLGLKRVPGIARLAWIDRHGGFWRRLQHYLVENPRDVAIAFMPRAMVPLALAHVPYPLVRIASTHSTPQRNFVEVSDDPDIVSMPAILRKALTRFDRITVLQAEFQDWYPPDLRARTRVIANPIGKAGKDATEHSREKLVLAVGRLDPVKGYDILIEAWAQLAPQYPDWRLEIYGQGALRAALQQQIDRAGPSESAALMGTRRDILEHYRHAAILAHPASNEGFGLVVAEALAAGIPVIGYADCPGINTLIMDGHNGVLAAGGDSRAARVTGFTKALGALMGDPEGRAALGANGPGSVALYAPEAVMAQWEALILDAWCEKAAEAKGTDQPRSDR